MQLTHGAGIELWAARTPETGAAERQAQRAEHAGWDGITFTDSQNLVGDPYVAAALAARATKHLRLATGVTNLFTRHPAALASVAVTVQEESGGRFALGVGRGDTALFHLGRKPMPVAEFATRLNQVQGYLAGETVDQSGHPSRLQWLGRTRQPKVPLDVAASGPRVLTLAGRIAERVTLAVGADVERLSWARDIARKAAADAGRDPASLAVGAYVNVGCHPDLETARSLIAGGVAAFAHFSAMPGSSGAGLGEADREIVAEVGRRYDSNVHLRNSAAHTEPLVPEFVDRFAIVGPPERCVARLRELASLGIGRVVVTGATFGSDPDAARLAARLFRDEVLPALKEIPTA